MPAVLLLSACHQQPLLHALTEQQANEVVAVLQAHDISVTKEEEGKSGFMVDVGQADFPAAVDLLHRYDLPSSPRMEIDKLFPSDALVASPQAEQARLLSGIEQRLEQSIAAMNNVVTARVQLSYPLQDPSDTKSEPVMHASVLITYRNDVNTDMLVSEVKRFVKNSFSNIDYDNISVIVSRAPDIYRGLATQPALSAHATWLYWLLAIPAGLATATAGLLVWLRLRGKPSHDGDDGEVEKSDAVESEDGGDNAPEQDGAAPGTPMSHIPKAPHGASDDSDNSQESA
ncbi:EscJ/YscJ/HrcJ family type III secretion inner membrane ring protein [Burkholderia pseudomallei]|nr:EscJ/YscJ/HrcJ family type III secretion inner membrane ring protein [Burkholderia pseudomallei]